MLETILYILVLVWDGIDWTRYTSQKVLRRIYDYYGDRIRSAASTNATYPTFIESLCRTMCSDTSHPNLAASLDADEEREFLRICREETRYLVAAFRQKIEDKKVKK